MGEYKCGEGRVESVRLQSLVQYIIVVLLRYATIHCDEKGRCRMTQGDHDQPAPEHTPAPTPPAADAPVTEPAQAEPPKEEPPAGEAAPAAE